MSKKTDDEDDNIDIDTGWSDTNKKKRKLSAPKEKPSNDLEANFKFYTKPGYKRLYSDLNKEIEEYPVYVESLNKEEKLGNKNPLTISKLFKHTILPFKLSNCMMKLPMNQLSLNEMKDIVSSLIEDFVVAENRLQSTVEELNDIQEFEIDVEANVSTSLPFRIEGRRIVDFSHFFD
ncbi:hypothetical protein evm_007462 [Chilo suppressalis]|nr:hypothetical protein evm_007462 [Chilo suppressalis]